MMYHWKSVVNFITVTVTLFLARFLLKARYFCCKNASSARHLRGILSMNICVEQMVLQLKNIATVLIQEVKRNGRLGVGSIQRLYRERRWQIHPCLSPVHQPQLYRQLQVRVWSH